MTCNCGQKILIEQNYGAEAQSQEAKSHADAGKKQSRKCDSHELPNGAELTFRLRPISHKSESATNPHVYMFYSRRFKILTYPIYVRNTEHQIFNSDSVFAITSGSIMMLCM